MSDSRTRLRHLGQLDLGMYIEAGTGGQLWSIQRQIATAISKHRARVAVPSCTGSGKSFVAARIALAFYDTYTPGTPCHACGGPCYGSKIITTSSKFEHLRDVLWSEMRTAAMQFEANDIKMPGVMARGQVLRLEDDPRHFIIGYSPNKAESLQGLHSAGHKLIIGDEATALDNEVQVGITGLLSTGDSRLLLIFNPTTDDTYAALQCRTPSTKVIKITAFDTPNFTGEPVPPGASLTTPEWLEDLADQGMGPGSYEHTTRVLAEFWTMGDDVLISPDNYDRAPMTEWIEGTRQLGVDLASYGTDSNVIAYRSGNGLVKLQEFPSMRQDTFFEGPVTDAVRDFDPDFLTWDADGVGAGVYGYVDTLISRHNRAGGNVTALPFRGGIHVPAKYLNARAAWYWNLRRRFEAGTIALILPPNDKLRAQLTDIRYSITDSGDIAIESKKHMKARGKESPDLGDACLVPGTLVTTSLGLVPIEEITPGDQVLTREGWHPVLFAGMTKTSAEIVTVKLVDGRCLTGTAEHRVWTENRGFVPMGYLTQYDTALLCETTSPSTAVITRPKPVPGVAKTSWRPPESLYVSVPIRVHHVTSLGDSSPVYNLTVVNCPEFFANDILVHNCMYAFALSEELSVPAKITSQPLADYTGLPDRSLEAMWRRDKQMMASRGQVGPRKPWDRMPVGTVWDDL